MVGANVELYTSSAMLLLLCHANAFANNGSEELKSTRPPGTLETLCIDRYYVITRLTAILV